MDQRKVRPIETATRSQSPPRWRRAGVAATGALLIVTLIATVDLVPDGAPDAEDVVRDFAASLGDGDVEAAAALVATDRSPFVLPALSAAIGPGDEPQESLAFVSSVATLQVGDCRVRLGAAAGREVVTCSLLVTSDYRDALGLGEAAGTLTASVRAGSIASLATTVDDRFAGYADYCGWALTVAPAESAGLFDARCRPVESAATGREHAALAARFAAAAERGPLSVVDDFARLHNEGAASVALFSDRFRVATFPGVPVAFPQWPFPDLDDYLEWSSAVYDFELGQCRADARGGDLVAVDCLEARLGGRLPAALGVGHVLTPVRFFVSGGQIVGVSGRSPDALVEAFAGRCADTDLSPFLAAGCTPRYDPESAAGLLAALERHG